MRKYRFDHCSLDQTHCLGNQQILSKKAQKCLHNHSGASKVVANFAGHYR